MTPPSCPSCGAPTRPDTDGAGGQTDECAACGWARPVPRIVLPVPDRSARAARQRAVEEQLAPAERAALATLQESLRVPPAMWLQCRLLRDPFTLAAWHRGVAERVVAGAGITVAQAEAAHALGEAPERLRSMARRL